jgi:hypothetical protein
MKVGTISFGLQADLSHDGVFKRGAWFWHSDIILVAEVYLSAGSDRADPHD